MGLEYGYVLFGNGYLKSGSDLYDNCHQVLKYKSVILILMYFYIFIYSIMY